MKFAWYEWSLSWMFLFLATLALHPAIFKDDCATTGAEMVDGKICTMPLARDWEGEK